MLLRSSVLFIKAWTSYSMVLLGWMLGWQLPNPLTQPLYPPQPLAERGFFPVLDVAVLHAGLCLAPTELRAHRSLPRSPRPSLALPPLSQTRALQGTIPWCR